MGSRRRPADRLTRLTDEWLDAQRSANTRAAYEADLSRFVVWCRVRHRSPLNATPDDLAAYGRDAAERWSDATLARRLSALSSFFRFAHSRRAIPTNPAVTVERPETRTTSGTRTLDGREIAVLLNAADELGPRTATLVALLLLDGLKLGEVLAADVGDLSGQPPVRLRVGRRQGALVELDRRTSRALVQQLAGRKDGPLLLTESPTHAGARLSRFGADYLLKQATTAAGLTTPLSANVLRRSFVTQAHDAGSSLGAIQARVGHDDQRTTRRLLTRSRCP